MTWNTIDSAPQDGSRFIGRQSFPDRYSGVMRYWKRVTWWGKTSHVPLYGWCHGKVENTDLWHPTHWRALPESK